VDPRRGFVVLRDPYPRFCGEDRVFRLGWFVRRWWDVNLTPLPKTGALQAIEDRHMVFVITSEGALFPAALGMIRG
jgi:hypothetical protein